jgi:PAS domain S-box-containing protein
MAEAIRVLYVDDEPGLLDIGKRFLERSGDFIVTTTTSTPEAIRLLEKERFDTIVSDYQMPGMDGIQFLVEVRRRFGEVPFILFTGKGREEVVIQAINSGADFYLQKGGEPGAQFAELSHKIKQAASRRRVDDALRKSEEKYRHLVEHSNEAIVVAQDGMLRLVNHKAAEFTGYSEQELLSMPFSTVIHPDDCAMVVDQYEKQLKREELPSRYSFRLDPKDSSTRWVENSVTSIDWEGRPATLNLLTDITERKRTEATFSIQHNLSIILNQCTKLDDAFNQILSFALQIEGLDAGGIYMADPVTGALDIVAHRGLSPQFIEHTSHFDANSPQVKRARTGIPFYGRYDEIRQPGRDEIRDKELVTALASIPVMHEGELLSILNLASHTAGEIPLSTRSTLETMAMQIGSTLFRIHSRKLIEESEARYRNVVEDQTEFISRFLPDGTHIFVNDAYCRYFGISRENLIGSRFRPSLPQKDQENLARLMASLTPDSPIMTIDQHIIMPDGSIRWQRWVDRAIFRKDGSLKEYQSVGRDITDWKQAEESLAESKEQLHLAIDGANLGIWDLNLITREMVFNQRWVEMLGFSQDEIEKPSVWWGARVHPDEYRSVVHLNELHRVGKSQFFDAVYRMRHKNGEWRWVHSQGKVISWDSTGAPLRMIGINQDITEQKVAEQDILRKNEELEASYEELTATSEELRQTIENLGISERDVREREQMLKAIVLGSPIPQFVIDQNHRVLHWNRALEEYSGISAGEVVGTDQQWRAFYYEERPCLADLLLEGEIDKIEGWYSGKFNKSTLIYGAYEATDFFPKLKGGTWLYFTAAPIRDHKGAVIGAVETLEDITQRKQVEGALKESEERYRNVIEDQNEFICRFLPDGIHIFVNNAYCRYFNLKREDIVGHRFRPYLHPEDRDRVKHLFGTLTLSQPVVNIDQRTIMPDGSTRWQRWSDRAIFDKNGKIIEYQSVGRDITEQKELEQERERHMQNLRQLSTSLAAANKKLNLLSSISRHDINNRLMVLQGQIAILEDTQIDPSQNKFFRKIMRTAEQISSIIRFTKEYEEVGFASPTWQEICTLADGASEEAVLIAVKVKNDLPVGADVFADLLLGKVFYNLIDNSIRYGEKTTQVRFSAEERDGTLVIICEDDGVGVPLDEKERIFERGYGNNTGLGLALSKEVLDITNITICETGEIGKGARFEMTVPKGMWRIGRGPE